MCHVIQEKRVLSDNFKKQMVELTEVVLAEIPDNILPVRPYLRRKPYVVATSQSIPSRETRIRGSESCRRFC